ncbi:MAG: c-type cytochrome [Thermodesulfobacteriota bacterium]
MATITARAARPSLVLALTLACVLAAPDAHARLREDLRGAQLYAAECAPCHGPSGRGDGPEGVYFAPRPRNLHEGFLALYETDELVARIRSGQPLMIEIDQVAVRRRARIVEDIVAHLERLPDVDWDRVERGAELFAVRCAGCHGPFGRPTAGADVPGETPRQDLSAPSFQRSASDGKLLELVQHRGDEMPRIAPLDASDARAVVAYVRVLSPGFELYSLWCAGCHGDDGRGEGELGVGADRPNVVFDRAYLRAQDPEDLRRNVVHMLESQEGAMPHMQRGLTEEQVRSIVEYLRATDKSPRPSPQRK